MGVMDTSSGAHVQAAGVVRSLRWWDLEAVVALEGELFPVDPWSATQWWTELAQPTRDYVVWDVDGIVNGYAGIFISAPTSDLQTIGVSPRMQGHGVGERLLTHMMECAVRAGCREMLLEVREDNESARKLYHRCGFDVISRRSRYYPDGATALIMRKELTRE